MNSIDEFVWTKVRNWSINSSFSLVLFFGCVSEWVFFFFFVRWVFGSWVTCNCGNDDRGGRIKNYVRFTEREDWLLDYCKKK